MELVKEATEATIKWAKKDLRARKVRTEARQDRVLIKMARARPVLARPTLGRIKILSLVKYQKTSSSSASLEPRYARPRHEDWILPAAS